MKSLSIFIFAFLMFTKFSFGQMSQSQIQHVDAESFKRIIEQKKGSLLDVRTSREYQNGHLENAALLNFYDKEFPQKILLLPKDKPVYLYCYTGARSKKAAQFLIKNGYKEVYNMRYGIIEWYRKSFPVSTSANATPNTQDKMELSEYQNLKNSKGLVFVDFYAPWCAPCKQFMPIFDELKKEHSDKANLVKINVDANRQLLKDLNVMGVPYLVMYKNGKVVFERNGIATKEEILKLIKENQ